MESNCDTSDFEKAEYPDNNKWDHSRHKSTLNQMEDEESKKQ
jgi:hypothetical protein